MSRRWELYLKDIIEAGQKILAYSDQLTYERFLADDRTHDAIIRNVEIIGEAVKQLPESVCQKAPNIEWRNISRMRDRIAHAYFGLDNAIVWDVVQNHIPDLLAAVISILAETDGD